MPLVTRVGARNRGGPAATRTGFPRTVTNGPTATFEALDFDVSLDGFSEYTLLIAKKDPGQGIVWAAFAALIVGLGITFYLPRRRVGARSERDGELALVGRSDRDVDFDRECGRLVDALAAARAGRETPGSHGAARGADA